MKLIRCFFLLTCLSLTLGACSQYSKVKELPMSKVASTGEQKSLYKSLRPLRKEPLAQIGRYLDEAHQAYQQLAKSPTDETQRSNYNFAVSRIMGIIEEEGLTPWETALLCGSAEGKPWSLSLKSISPRPDHNPSNFHLLPADRYTFKGKLVGERSLKEGLGAPLIAYVRDLDFNNIAAYRVEDRSLFYGVTAVLRFQGRNCELELVDPLAREKVTVNNRNYPLAADFQAPLALALANVNVKKYELAWMFGASKHEEESQLTRLEPYNPAKIPVLFVHGLGNSPAYYFPMIEYLRTDPKIRKRFQFWYFAYPTGLPYPLNAAKLHDQLDKMRERYPNHKDIIIVAHSLGGNISRMLISDSGTTLWDTYFDAPPEKLPIHPESRKKISDMLIFKARPDLDRVIFASASLRGSKMSTDFIGRLGAKIIGNPFSENQFTEEVLDHVRPEIKAMGRKHLPNSIELLDPDSLFLKTVNNLPIKAGIPYHSIMGDRGKGGNLDKTEPVNTDGIVPYWSAHLEGAQSEKIVPSDHWTILHPDGMKEVKRILLQHAK